MTIRSALPAPRSRDRVVTVGEDGCVKVWTIAKSGRLTQVCFFLAQPQPGAGTSSRAQSRQCCATSMLVIRGTSIIIVAFDEGTLQGWVLPNLGDTAAPAWGKPSREPSSHPMDTDILEESEYRLFSKHPHARRISALSAHPDSVHFHPHPASFISDPSSLNPLSLTTP